MREVFLASQAEMVVVLLRCVFSQRHLVAKNHTISREDQYDSSAHALKGEFGKRRFWQWGLESASFSIATFCAVYEVLNC